jgi:hypothetical protein
MAHRMLDRSCCCQAGSGDATSRLHQYRDGLERELAAVNARIAELEKEP